MKPRGQSRKEAPLFKFITLLNRKPGMSHAEFARYWEEQHGPLVVKIMPGVKRYVQNHVAPLPGMDEPPFDGAAEVWYEGTWQELLAWYQSEAGRALRDDERKFIDTSRWIPCSSRRRCSRGRWAALSPDSRPSGRCPGAALGCD